MKKKLALVISISALTCAAMACVLIKDIKPAKSFSGRANADEYVMTLGDGATPEQITDSYQNNVAGDVSTNNGNKVKLSFTNAKTLANGFAELAPHGKIHNFNDSNQQLTGVNGVSFTGSGTLLFKPAVVKGLLADVSPISVAAGASKVAVPTCDYFEIEAADGGAQIETLSFTYSCDGNAYDVKLANGTYTGVGTDSNTWKLVLEDGAVTVDSLDKVSNLHLEGTATMTSKTAVQVSLPSAAMVINYTYDGHSLTYASKDGYGAENYPNVSGTRVYTVENFESYSATGQGYINSEKKYQTSGLRSQFYADYYTGSSSGEIGGSGWPVMTSTDNTNFNGSKGHNGSKTGIFKFSNGMGMRYISMNELYGVKRLVGKGQTLSFWARGAYTNTNFNTNHGSNTTMKFYLYYDTPLTPSNQTTVRESYDFTVQKGDEWQHFEFPITAGRNYRGFGFYAQQSSGSTQYLPLDDIQIYSASPYAEYIAPVAATGVTVSPSSAELTVGGTQQLTATVAPNDATNKVVAWTSNNTSVATVSSTGLVTANAAGNATITATTDDGGFTDTCSVTVSNPVLNYPEGTYKGTATVLGADYTIVISIGTQSNGLVAVRLANKDAVATGITYNSSTNAITITTTGDYSGYTYGNITGTFDQAGARITGISCSGSISAGVSNNGSIVAERAVTSDNTYFADCDGTTSELQAQFKRRYMSGSWQVDNSNADRITSNTTEYVSGTGAVKRRGYSGGAVALNFQNDFATAKKVQNVQFWVYNPSGSDITLRMWYYRAASFGSNGETGSVVAKASGWTYVAMGFGEIGSSPIYNFQIADFTNSGQYLTFDNIYLF